MKQILYICVLSLLSVMTIKAQSNDLIAADSAYANGNYTKAIELYGKTLNESGQSSDLYYNLGNSFFKDKQYAAAILNYERALLLSPSNQDARFNLEIARTRIVDKIEPVGVFFLSNWIKGIENTMSSNGWAMLGIISFILIISCLFLYFFTRNVALKKIGFFGGIILLFICIISNNFASDQKERLTVRDNAIIFAPTITVKSSPAESGTDLFVLHEGTKVSVKSKLGQWSEIELEDGNKGWIPSSQIEVI